MTPNILVLADVNTTSGGTLYEANRDLCDCLAQKYGAWVALQPYAALGNPTTEKEWTESAKYIAQKFDGYVSLGGIFDMPDHFYLSGKRICPPTDVSWTPEKSRFPIDSALMNVFLEQRKPIFAICGGMQVLAGVLGCKLGEVEGHSFPYTQTHKLQLTNGTQLSEIIGSPTVEICSRHREQILEISENVLVSARTEDNVVEGIEAKGHPFAIGIQGHPERHLSDPQSPWHRLLRAYVSKTMQQAAVK